MKKLFDDVTKYALQTTISAYMHQKVAVPFAELKQVIIDKNAFFVDNRVFEALDEDLLELLFLADRRLSIYQVVDGMIQRRHFEPFRQKFTTSGKLIVENDLREFFGDCLYLDYGDPKEHKELMNEYFLKGMLHGYVGNSCPEISVSNKEIVIGLKYDEETNSPIIPEGAKIACSVCTDLWWYSIVDLGVFQKMHPEVDTKNFTIIDVPEGDYMFEHYYGISSTKHSEVPFAKLIKL